MLKEMSRMVVSVALALMIAGCASPAGSSAGPSDGSWAGPSASPAPSAGPSPAIVCDTAQFQPAPPLTCRPAIGAAVALLAGGHPAIVSEEFRWGGLCPPGAPCVPPMPDAGIVIIGFAGGSSVYILVNAATSGSLTTTAAEPYPSGY